MKGSNNACPHPNTYPAPPVTIPPGGLLQFLKAAHKPTHPTSAVAPDGLTPAATEKGATTPYFSVLSYLATLALLTGVLSLFNVAPARAQSQNNAVWEATLTVQENAFASNRGCIPYEGNAVACASALTSSNFSLSGVDYAIIQIFHNANGGLFF